MSNQSDNLIEIHLDTYDKDTLIGLIEYAHQRNITFNEAVNQILQDVIENYNVIIQ